MSYYNDDEHNLTSKEIWIGLVVLILSLTLAFIFEPYAKNSLLGDIRKYNLALQITDPIQFQYAHKTQVGDVLAYGKMIADKPVSFDELKKGFSLISKVEEHYTMHSREVCSGTDEDGNCDSWTTEYYWTWDTYGHQNLASATFTFLGEKFNFSDLNLSTEYRLPLKSDTIYEYNLKDVRGNYLYDANDSDVRWYYNVTEIEFNVTMFVSFYNDKISDPLGSAKISTYYQEPISGVIQDKKNSLVVFDWLWFTGFPIVFVGAYIFWAWEFIDIK